MFGKSGAAQRFVANPAFCRVGSATALALYRASYSVRCQWVIGRATQLNCGGIILIVSWQVANGSVLDDMMSVFAPSIS